jgi:hypothetical protein
MISDIFSFIQDAKQFKKNEKKISISTNFLGPSTTEETWLVKMCIWCIKIGIVLDLHFNPWVEASAGGL